MELLLPEFWQGVVTMALRISRRLEGIKRPRFSYSVGPTILTLRVPAAVPWSRNSPSFNP